jgi:hypothetical protein
MRREAELHELRLNMIHSRDNMLRVDFDRKLKELENLKN